MLHKLLHRRGGVSEFDENYRAFTLNTNLVSLSDYDGSLKMIETNSKFGKFYEIWNSRSVSRDDINDDKRYNVRCPVR